jgi:hypothetical protein
MSLAKTPPNLGHHLDHFSEVVERLASSNLVDQERPERTPIIGNLGVVAVRFAAPEGLWDTLEEEAAGLALHHSGPHALDNLHDTREHHELRSRHGGSDLELPKHLAVARSIISLGHPNASLNLRNNDYKNFMLGYSPLGHTDHSPGKETFPASILLARDHGTVGGVKVAGAKVPYSNGHIVVFPGSVLPHSPYVRRANTGRGVHRETLGIQSDYRIPSEQTAA